MNSEKTLMLIDAYAQIYRGFYALPPMSSSKGVYTNAVYAFARFLLNLDKEYSTEYGAVVFDLGKCAARLEILPEYKANRPPMPDELRSQVPYIREITEAFGYSIIEHEGTEADDLIAALAENFADFAVKIVSADKDIAQVIDGRVEMLVPARKGGGFDRRGVDEVFAKFAVTPGQIVDYLSLIGDSSDNIPGVQGVGPKTAAKLIDRCGSIEAMLRNPELIEKEKLRDKIIASADILRKNIELIKLDRTLPDERWKDEGIITRKPPDWGAVRGIAEDLELKSFLNQLDEFMAENGIMPAEKAEKTARTESEEDHSGITEEQDLFTSVSPTSAENREKLSTDNSESCTDGEQDLFTPDFFR